MLLLSLISFQQMVIKKILDSLQKDSCSNKYHLLKCANSINQQKLRADYYKFQQFSRIIKLLFELSIEMQEAKDQSQFFINPQLITVQDIEKKLKCPMGNQAFSLCSNQQCQKPKGVMCRIKQCECNNLHTSCHSFQLKGILINLLQHRLDITQEIQRSFKVARQTINAIIQQLSKAIYRLEVQQKHFGLRQCEISFMGLIEQQQFEKICGKFTNELVKKSQSKKALSIRSKEIIVKEFQTRKSKCDAMFEQILKDTTKLVPQFNEVLITPDKQSRGLKDGYWIIQNTNSNVCIGGNLNFWNSLYSNWLCSSALPFAGDFVFTIKVLKLTDGIRIGVMEEEKKGEKWCDTWNHSVYLDPLNQYIRRPNEEQTKYQLIKCSCSTSLPQCPFQIECHVNRQQNTIAWHYDGKQQAKSIMPKAWKTKWFWRQRKSLCAIVYVYVKGDSVQMM